jgi:NAD+ diphosphatase
MFQDIAPKVFDNHYNRKTAPSKDDYVVIYHDRKAVLYKGKQLPRYKEVTAQWHFDPEQYTYLFSIDQSRFYLIEDPVVETTDYRYEDVGAFRHLDPEWLGYAGATACHLASWYATNRFCGRCGHQMGRETEERALKCPNCHREIFPTIAPAIIVGVTDGNRLLLTRNLNGYRRRTLISGYVEVGESMEATVQREVTEEVGLAVHNIRYYASQPWAFSGSVLMGFFADLNEDLAIQLERDELANAAWYDRKDLPKDDTTLSLTWRMIEAFRHAEV